MYDVGLMRPPPSLPRMSRLVSTIHLPALCSQMVAVVLQPSLQDPHPEGVPSPERAAFLEAFLEGVAFPEVVASPEGVEHILEGAEHILEGA